MVSIIVPVRNGETHIRRCIDSVLGGTYTDIELIIVENGSEDATLEVCRAAAARDARIRVLTTDRSGVSHARNLGLDAACGDYISFVDADDLISPVMLTHMTACAETTGCDVCFAYCAEGQSADYLFPETAGACVPFTTAAFLRGTYLTAETDYSSVCNKLFARTLIGGLRFDESLRMAEDRSFLVRAVSRASCLCRLDEKLYYYWKGNQASAVHGADSARRMDQVYSLQSDIAFLEKEHPDQPLWREYAACCLLQNADQRLRVAIKDDLDDIAAKVRPIAKEAARMVKKAGHIPKKTRFRLLLEHRSPTLYALAAGAAGRKSKV